MHLLYSHMKYYMGLNSVERHLTPSPLILLSRDRSLFALAVIQALLVSLPVDLLFADEKFKSKKNFTVSFY